MHLSVVCIGILICLGIIIPYLFHIFKRVVNVSYEISVSVGDFIKLAVICVIRIICKKLISCLYGIFISERVVGKSIGGAARGYAAAL